MISKFNKPKLVNIEVFNTDSDNMHINEIVTCLTSYCKSKNINVLYYDFEHVNFKLQAGSIYELKYFEKYNYIKSTFKKISYILCAYTMYEYNRFINKVYNHKIPIDNQSIVIYRDGGLFTKFIELSLRYISTVDYIHDYHNEELLKSYIKDFISQESLILPYLNNLNESLINKFDLTLDCTMESFGRNLDSFKSLNLSAEERLKYILTNKLIDMEDYYITNIKTYMFKNIMFLNKYRDMDCLVKTILKNLKIEQ